MSVYCVFVLFRVAFCFFEPWRLDMNDRRSVETGKNGGLCV